MDSIINNEQKLTFSWYPGCIYNRHDNSYTVGEISRRGPGSKQILDPWTCPSVPSSLSFSIRFKNKDDLELFQEIKTMLHSLIDHEQMQIMTYSPQFMREQIVVKDKYREEVDQIIISNEIVKEKFRLLKLQLEELGCDHTNLKGPAYKTIPDEYYEWHEYYNSQKSGFTVYCHNETIFYKALNDSGILDKYFPEWYKAGNF
jgi:hypothetical protein